MNHLPSHHVCLAKVNKHKKALHRQRGASLLSVMLGASASALFVYFLVVQVKQVYVSHKANSAVQQIIPAIADIKTLYGNQYESVTTEVAIGGPLQFLRVGTTQTARNGFNGAVTLVPNTITSSNDSAKLSWNGVPSSACQQIVKGVYDAGATRQIQVGGSDVQPADGALSVATLATQCSSADPVNVDFIIGRY